jgi:ABC-2 type transport system permease protein
MPNSYSQFKAMMAIARASLIAIFRSPQAVFFSLFFPIVLIVVFGALSGIGGISFNIAFDSKSDTSNIIYWVIKNKIPILNVENAPEEELLDRLKKGRITALINIQKIPACDTCAKYDLHFMTTSAGQRDLPFLQPVIRQAVETVNARSSEQPTTGQYVSISTEQIPARVYRMIDFYLPGMIGFSLMGSAVFGVAFVYLTFRETLVLKRLFSTPVKRGYMLLGESIARIAFLITTAIVLIVFGRYFYHFTLANGFVTFLEMLVISLVGIIVFMGFGFVISGISKNQNVVPVYANLFMFPQYFLSGTFFPITGLPANMQAIVKYLPLTAFNDAMRKVSFEGSHIWDVGRELGIMAAWCLLAYAVAIKVFKWE